LKFLFSIGNAIYSRFLGPKCCKNTILRNFVFFVEKYQTQNSKNCILELLEINGSFVLDLYFNYVKETYFLFRIIVVVDDAS